MLHSRHVRAVVTVGPGLSPQLPHRHCSGERTAAVRAQLPWLQQGLPAIPPGGCAPGVGQAENLGHGAYGPTGRRVYGFSGDGRPAKENRAAAGFGKALACATRQADGAGAPVLTSRLLLFVENRIS